MAAGEGPGTPGEWVLLTYRLPREPSTPRIAVWRRLKRMGVAQLGDGLVGLPCDARTREQVEWVAEEILEAGGAAGVWLARPGALAQERDLVAQLRGARADEYAAMTAQAASAAALNDGPDRTRQLGRLRRHWREITRRDYFPPTAERDAAAAAIRQLSEATRADPVQATTGVEA